MAIAAEERDAIAALYARLTQSAGKTADAVGHLRVCKPFLIADDSRAARILLRRVTQETQRREWDVHSALAWIRRIDLHQLPVFAR
jgi:hypothetical protein